MKCLLVKVNGEIEEMNFDTKDKNYFREMEKVLNTETIDVRVGRYGIHDDQKVLMYMVDLAPIDAKLNPIATALYGGAVPCDVIISGAEMTDDGLDKCDLDEKGRELIYQLRDMYKEKGLYKEQIKF